MNSPGVGGLSLVSYLGIKIPPTNLQPEGDDAARAFAVQLVDRLGAPGSSATTA
jgi:hypothetical protein